MSRPAARLTDMHVCPMVSGLVPHVGGPIVAPGAPNVLVNGLPAARITDIALCVGPPDAIVTGAFRVLVGGLPFARVGDSTMHGGVIVTGSPNVLIGENGTAAGGGAGAGGAGAAPAGAGPGDAGQDFNITGGVEPNKNVTTDVLYLNAEGKIIRAGMLGHASGKLDIGGAKIEHAGHFGGSIFGGSHKLQLLSVEGKVEAGSAYGVGAAASAKASMAEEEGSLFAGSDENNPWVEVGAGYSLFQAKAKGNILYGNDGSRRGYVIAGEAKAEAVSGDLKAELNVPIPFSDYTMSLRGRAGGSLGSGGAGGEAYAYQDLKSGRGHIGIGGEIAAAIGLKMDIDLSVGPPYNSRDRGNTP